MTSKVETDVNFNDIRGWIQRAGKNSEHCFICKCIWAVHKDGTGQIGTIKISSVEMTPDVQITHLAHCVGRNFPDSSV
jgi:hypothetical protein